MPRESHVIDENLRVKIIRTAASASWYVQYNRPGHG
jgi:hypothetical protein